MKLSLLFKDLPTPFVLPDINVTLVTERTDLADANAVFVCIRGARIDGHDLAFRAYEKGCRVFLAEKALLLPADAIVIPNNDTRAALAHLACTLYQNPSHTMRLIGITGTKGKTTTAQLLTHILNRGGIPCGYIGTNGIRYANVQLSTNNTTPDAVTLQQTLFRMQQAGVKTAVIEVSSQALMQRRVDGIRFEAVLFTNLSPDHIGPNEHRDFAHYKACKQRLFTDFGASYAICNIDDAAASDMLDVSTANERITCATTLADASFFADHIQLLATKTKLGVAFDLHHKTALHRCELSLIGSVNASNALLALATAHRVFGIALDHAVKSLADATVSGRSELLPLANGAHAVIDYAHNGASLRQLLGTLREYRPKRLIVLFGSIGERAQLRRYELGRAAAELCDQAILTSDNPANEDPEAIIDEIAAAFEGFSTPYVKITDRAQAIQSAVRMAQSGDILVLAGKGHEDYQLIGDEKIPFSERKIIEEALPLIETVK